MSDSATWHQSVPAPLLTDSAVTTVGVPPIAFELALGAVRAIEHEGLIGPALPRSVSVNGASVIVEDADTGKHYMIGISVREVPDV